MARSIDTAHSNLDSSHISHLPNPLTGPPSPPRSSPVLTSLHSHVDQAQDPIQVQKPDLESERSQVAIDEFDQDEFSGLLEDMDMLDVTDLMISHGPTPQPASFQGPGLDHELVYDQDQGSPSAYINNLGEDQESMRGQNQTQDQALTSHPHTPVHVYDESQELGEASFTGVRSGQAIVPPTPYPKRRRRIIEEDLSQLTNEETDAILKESSDGPKTAAETSQDINTHSACPSDKKQSTSRDPDTFTELSKESDLGS
ncbi:hypothetical protein EC968_001403 [Mortierella alpina]|nr:hypothetical protein EC968_001403 [Mortierella alpina]